MEILEQVNNKLLHRKEIVLVVESDSTPTNNGLLDEIAEKFKAKKEDIAIVYIKGKFGTNQFEVFVKIYDNLESRERYETVTRKARKKSAEEKKKVDEETKKAKAEKKLKKAAEETAHEKPSDAAEKPAEEQAEQPKETPAELQEESNPEQEPKQELKPEGSQPEEEL